MIEPHSMKQLVGFQATSWLSAPAQANLLQLANKMALARDTNLSTCIENKESSSTRSNLDLSISSRTEKTERVI